jgi:hypothetical protein
VDPAHLDRFNGVSIDQADLDPAILHVWPDHEAGMVALAQRWVAAGRGEKASESNASR